MKILRTIEFFIYKTRLAHPILFYNPMKDIIEWAMID